MKTEIAGIEKWGMFELRLNGPKINNPFIDTELTVRFSCMHQVKVVDGFYDGDGIYIVRFMPEILGEWTYVTTSNKKELDSISGTFLCIEPGAGNHGPVRVHNQYHFAYADGMTFYPFGTTCYAWIHQSEELQTQTLETLRNHDFNKLRMCVFPKFYSNNAVEPSLYPFEGQAPDMWDFSKFNPAFFRHLEEQVTKLMEMEIQVDLILFHPYDKGHWGFDRMSMETDQRYLHYMVARFGAFRNIWWSMANEYDYMEKKTREDWERNIALVSDMDPYHHLLSIHQAEVLYDHWNPHLTHASIQLGYVKDMVDAGAGQFRMLRDAYHKPVIYDEVGYEGNLVQRWGRLTAEELVDKFWRAITVGTYMTHGETFTHPDDIIWWAKGGELRGKSPDRIRFLKKLVENSGIDGLDPLDDWWILNGVGRNGDYYLFYFGEEQPTEWKFELPGFKFEIPIGTKFRVDVVDTWNMTVTPVEQLFEITDKSRYKYTCNYNPVVKLPGKKHMAIQISRVSK